MRLTGLTTSRACRRAAAWERACASGSERKFLKGPTVLVTDPLEARLLHDSPSKLRIKKRPGWIALQFRHDPRIASQRVLERYASVRVAFRAGGKCRLPELNPRRRNRSFLYSSSKCAMEGLIRSLRDTIPTRRSVFVSLTTGSRSRPCTASRVATRRQVSPGNATTGACSLSTSARRESGV